MKNVKKIAVRSCVVLLFVAGLEFMARFCYESWKTYLLTSKRERSEMKGTIETLYCGTSLAARAFQPAAQDYIDGGGDLDNLDDTCRVLAGEMDANYYNFMLYKDRQTVFTDDKFGDAKHFNVDGGPAFSAVFAEVLQSSDPQAFFYDSIKDFGERLKEEET